MKHTLILVTLLALTACGFRPVHSTSYRAEQDASLASVEVVVNNSRLGQLLKAEIERGVNPDYQRSEKLYTLSITLSERDVYLFINPDGTAGRGDVLFNSTFTLQRRVDSQQVAKGNLNRTASYNISETADYATYVSEEDARKRGIVELANDYKLRLVSLMHEQGAAE